MFNKKIMIADETWKDFKRNSPDTHLMHRSDINLQTEPPMTGEYLAKAIGQQIHGV
jgi:hypothetical protein